MRRDLKNTAALKIACCAIALLPLGFFAVKASAQNLLTNPDFEPTLNGWHLATVRNACDCNVNTAPQHGTCCLLISFNLSNSLSMVRQLVPISAGTTYTVSGWMKTQATISYSFARVLWYNTANPADMSQQGSSGYFKVDTIGVLTGGKDWTQVSRTLTVPANALGAELELDGDNPNSTGYAWWDNFDFEIAGNIIPPRLISAVASDNTVKQVGIDNDDYVLLTFDKAVATFTVTPQNINTIFPISNGHNWLSGFGTFGSAVWNPDSTKLLITLSTTVSAPTIAVGDSISFITGSIGTPGKVALTGSFDPINGIQQRANSFSDNLFRITKTSGSIHFAYPEQVHLKIFDVKGTSIADLGSGKIFTWDYTSIKYRAAAGLYYAQLFNDDHMVTGKKVLIP